MPSAVLAHARVPTLFSPLFPWLFFRFVTAISLPLLQERNAYVLHFDEDDYEDGRVRYQEIPIRFVVELPAPKRAAK